MDAASLLAQDLDNVVNRVDEAWAGLRGARLFITGGTGFFGTWMLESFLWANRQRRLEAQAVALVRDAASFRKRWPKLAADPALALLEGDVRSFEFPKGPFTHVIHLASSARPGEVGPEALLDLIIRGTERTLEFARQAGTSRYLFASSGAVYGPQPANMTHIAEDYLGGPNPMNAQSSYAEGKRVAELLCALSCQESALQVVIARGFAFVGPYLPLDVHFAIGNFIRDGLRGGPIQVNSDGTAVRSYLYAADLAAWLWVMLLQGQSCRPYNVGSEQAVSIAELAARIARYFGTEVRMARQPVPGTPAQHYVPSTQRARQELGLDAWTTLDEAIDRTARWNSGQCSPHAPREDSP